MSSKIKSVIGIVVIAVIVLYSPFGHEQGEFSKVLYSLGYHQQEASEKISSYAVKDLEGELVGDHKVNGSNWAIPNIVRYWLGVND